MILLTETVLFHQNLLDEYERSQNEDGFTAGFGTIADWADKVAAANSPSIPQRSQHPRPSSNSTTGSHNEPDQSLCPPPSKRARISAPQGKLGDGVYNKYIKYDLPPGATTDNAWHRVFIPTLADLSGTCVDPWKGFPDDILLETLQEIWDTVYRDSIPHLVVVGGPVYSISKKALDNWRGGFAVAAVAAVTRFFATIRDFEDSTNCVAFADAMLVKKRFLFSNNEGPDPKAWTGLWRSPFVLHTFAHHFNFVRGHVEVWSLPFEHRGPRGALALASAAVDWVLTLIKNDPVAFKAFARVDGDSTALRENAQYEFNEGGWGRTTLKYLVPIQRLTEEQFQTVIDATLPYIKCVESPSTTVDDDYED